VEATGSFFMSATLGGWAVGLSATLVGFCRFLLAFAGWLSVLRKACWCGLPLRWHPRDVIGSLALPLCGAAPTFLCRRKEK
jgi:hypothetical protein